MNKKILRNYAKVIVNIGANVQKKQDVIVVANLDQEELVNYIVEECYKAKANFVTVRWNSEKVARTAYKKGSIKGLSEVTPWQIEREKYINKTLPAFIYIDSDDPDNMKGINQKKMAIIRQNFSKIMKPFRDERDCKYQWTIVGAPSVAWAKKVFPNESKKAAVNKLWDAILHTARCDCDDPVASWNKHNNSFKSRCEYLNSLGLKSLHYTSKNGTDFTVGLIPNCNFLGGGEYTLGGVYYNPNMPTEEIFTSPKRGVADGIVYATKPLSYMGQLITDFWVKFKDGKAIDVGAKENVELLREMIKMDEGAAYLGECALVPYSSPINQTGILFYSTLFDENACCHLALGAGFNNCYQDFEKYTLDELNEKGINDSSIHVDFMIGSPDMKIVGITKDDKEIIIFKDGEWAF